MQIFAKSKAAFVIGFGDIFNQGVPSSSFSTVLSYPLALSHNFIFLLLTHASVGRGVGHFLVHSWRWETFTPFQFIIPYLFVSNSGSPEFFLNPRIHMGSSSSIYSEKMLFTLLY